MRAERIPHLAGVVDLGWGDFSRDDRNRCAQFETPGQQNDATIVGLGAALSSTS